MTKSTGALMRMIVAMTIFGTIGLVVTYIPLDSSLIALARAVGGFLFLFCIMLASGKRPSFAAIKQNLLWLCPAGLFLGFNWILLFESYRYTSVAVSTLCYYMAPIILICVSPIFLKEKLTVLKIVCVFVALLGMVFISGVLSVGFTGGAETTGILLGIAAALLYAAIMLMNKQLRNISAYDRTLFQLGFSAIVLIPYCLLTCDLSAINLDFTQWALVALIAIVHTGFSYYLYFGSMEDLPGQTIAMISYIDPVMALLCSAFILQQPFKPFDIPGAILIIGAALVSECFSKHKLPGKRIK